MTTLYLSFLFSLMFIGKTAYASEIEQVKAELKDTIILYTIALAEERGVDSNLAVKLAVCESGLRHDATNHNPKELSVGIFQINTKVHEVTIAEAKDPIFNVKWAMEHLSKGRWEMWLNCSRKIGVAV